MGNSKKLTFFRVKIMNICLFPFILFSLVLNNKIINFPDKYNTIESEHL